ncbi:MAG: hypothetical protein ACI9OU_001325 [Candidatus Promineifilaceae bacterium]|jgi:hypothetical protein
MKVVVAQKGSREHFLAARALHDRGHLAALVADWYAPRLPWLHTLSQRLGLAPLKRLMAARCDTLPDALVYSFGRHGIRSRQREIAALRHGAPYAAYLSTDAAFAQRVAALDLPPHDVFFGFSYASLEAMAVAKAKGKLVLLDQIDPGPPEARLVQAERKAWPNYALPMTHAPAAYYDRLRQEWNLADAILVNSEWTRDLIVEEGVDPKKIDILPLAYAPPNQRPEQHQPHDGPLRVLWLGTVTLRKGISYLVEAAKRFAPSDIEITVAGRIDISAAAIAQAPACIRWVGPIPRPQTEALYRAADVFVLPTVSDGFALTQLEALAQGVPVIVTPNCARIVEEGRTGFVVPARDVTALAEALAHCRDHANDLAAMAPACIDRANAFSHETYAQRLLEIIENRMALKQQQKTTV